MNHIYTITSTAELDDKETQDIKERRISQLFNYLHTGAEAYLERRDIKFPDFQHLQLNDYQDFAKKYCLKKGKRIAVISLGCGDSNKEKYIFKSLLKDHDIDLYLVDSSRYMLDKSISSLSSLDIRKEFIEADFSSPRFRQYIETITDDYDQRIFCFWGNTLGNISQTHIIDTLYNVMRKDDIVWLDVKMRSGTDDISALLDAEKYNKYLQDKYAFSEFCYPLIELGITKEHGHMGMKFEIDKNMNATSFQFRFLFTKPAIIKVHNEIIHISENEKIELVKIYNYDHDSLVKFFENREFKFISSKVNNMGQFVFKR